MRLSLTCLAAFTLMLLAAPAALASSPGSGSPSINIISPSNGSTVRGSTLTIHVAVSNFKLVKPVYLHPPMLKGNQGHIHYVLDALSNFIATRDATIAMSHTWTNVQPGHHTLIAYLATSQHAMFPGAKEAQVSINVLPASTTSSSKPALTLSAKAVSAKAPAAKRPGITAMPRTGGAVGVSRSWFDLSVLLAAVAAVILGFGLRCRQLVLERVASRR